MIFVLTCFYSTFSPFLRYINRQDFSTSPVMKVALFIKTIEDTETIQSMPCQYSFSSFALWLISCFFPSLIKRMYNVITFMFYYK